MQHIYHIYIGITIYISYYKLIYIKKKNTLTFDNITRS